MITGSIGIASFIGPLFDIPSKYNNTISGASGQKILNWFGGVSLGIATVSALTLFAINKYKKNSLSKPEGQEKIRNEYKEAYLKVTQENEQLKVQLAVLQNK